MAKEKEFIYTEYEEAAIELFQKMFGEESLNKLEDKDIKSFKWDSDVDITTHHLTACDYGIKDIFESNIVLSAFKERRTPMSLFIQKVFQMGYQQCVHKLLNEREAMHEKWEQRSETQISYYKNRCDELTKELEELKEKYDNQED